MRFLRPLALVLVLMATGGVASAHEFEIGDLELDHPWIAEPPPGAPTAAGYLEITNESDAADRLIAVRCVFARKAEIHEVTIDAAGTMQMRPLPDGIEIPAGGTVTLARGGYHLMFMHVAERPVAGDMIPVTLIFEHAGEIDVMFSVQKPGMQDDDHMDMDMDMDGTMEMESGQ
jgi:periplasmic copper chaperone A